MIRGKAWIGAALVAAALAGGATTSAIVVIVTLILSSGGGGAIEPQGIALFLAVGAAVASAIFLAGLVFIGAPVWAIMHRRGLRECRHAKTAGAVLAAGVVLAGGVMLGLSAQSGPQGLAGGLIFAVIMLGPGAAAGWTLHRVAYTGPIRR